MPARRPGAFLTRSVRESLRRGGPHAADERLLEEIGNRNLRGVEELIATGGASADGSENLEVAPIALATAMGQLGVIELLHERGASLDTPAPGDYSTEAGNVVCRESWSPLHTAVGCGRAVIIRALLRLGANPNATDDVGTTPLMGACCVAAPEEGQRCSLVRALLEGGADPTLGNEWGMVALHFAARIGDTDVMGELLRSAPSTLNISDDMGCTALSHAALISPCTSVAYLLSAGASEKTVLAQTGKSALLRTIEQGQEDVVRLLLDEGMEAVEGMPTMSMALQVAIEARRATILHILMTAHIGAGVSEEYWAQHQLESARVPVLHYAAAFGSLSTIHVLLAAGADETALSSEAKRASDVIGQDRPAAEEAAISRMLERGQAFRARSWTWQPMVNSEFDGTPTRRRPGPSIGVRIFRGEDRRVCTTRFARYVLMGSIR